jgi:2Fe-2S ferredoxin
MVTFYIIRNGEKIQAEASIGDNLMLALGVMGDCGGENICSTCHVKIDPPIEPPSDDEKFTLDIADNVEYNSRLSCQVVVDETLQDKTVRIINNEILY